MECGPKSKPLVCLELIRNWPRGGRPEVRNELFIGTPDLISLTDRYSVSVGHAVVEVLMVELNLLVGPFRAVLDGIRSSVVTACAV
jgi:hypothetical protein